MTTLTHFVSITDYMSSIFTSCISRPSSLHSRLSQWMKTRNDPVSDTYWASGRASSHTKILYQSSLCIKRVKW